MKLLLLSVVGLAALSAAQGTQRFTGTIAESECANADHSAMRMGPTDAECAVACVDTHGATYVLYDGKDAYALSDQKTPQKFATQRVTIVGTLDARTRTILVDSIAAAK